MAGPPTAASAAASGTSAAAPSAAAPSPPLPVDPATVDVNAAARKFGWDLEERPDYSGDRQVMEVPLRVIHRPLPRANNPEKVAALMRSIQEIGQQEPIDVLEVDGQIYGFSGCHRFEAHQRLGRETILCRVRRANHQVLKVHMM
eukprot:scaffold5.g713.t1